MIYICTNLTGDLRHELAERLGKDSSLSGVSVIGLDPGGMGTGLARRSNLKMRLMMKSIPLISPWMVGSDPNGTVRPVRKSAADVIRACFEIQTPKGKAYYLNGTDELETAKTSKDSSKRRELWDYGLKLASLGPSDTALEAWQ